MTAQGHNVPAASRIIGVSERYLRDLIERRAIGYCKIGRRIVITDRQIEEFHARHEVRPKRVVDVGVANPEHRHIRVVPPRAS